GWGFVLGCSGKGDWKSWVRWWSELDGEAGFADFTRGGVDSSGLSHDESFGVDDMDLNLNEPVNLNVSQVKLQYKLPMFEEPDVGRTQELILSEISTQEPIVAEVSNEEDEPAPTDGQFFYDDEGIDTAYETEYDVKYSEDAGTDDDDVDEDFLVDEENEIVEPAVDVHLFGIIMDLPFDNIELKRRDNIVYASEMELKCEKVKEMKNKLSAYQDTISVLKQQKDAQIKLYKSREDKEIEKVIDLENKVK
nr:hypothetical protein [Tanacetum cinerariifolium]